ncbi:4402_t:CDS:2 [Diversispora eburnea]|uniref:4402_t:CDS:1 n=1 Tax=Diversispora eburnea TaxID=1213867 RepID=A0A9N9GMZ8_9GLOM|nr:4402_t:CDS:2 [Diversispora eburnea]
MTKITSILAVVGLVFSCLILIAQAADPPTSIGNPDFPNDLEIPAGIAVDLTLNKFSFSLCLVGVIDFTCNTATGTWNVVGPTGVLANECKDFSKVAGDPKFITATTLDTESVTNAGLRSAVLPNDTSTAIFTREAAENSPNPSVDTTWIRSKASDQTGNGKFVQVTYLQRVLTTGGLPPPTSESLHIYST